MSDIPDFDAAFQRRLEDLFVWRRDVRSFRREPLESGALDRLIGIACLAPSVGLSEPWRFVVVDDAERRRAIRDSFFRSNEAALAAQPADLAPLYAALKLAGLDDAPCQLAIFAERETLQGHGLGRATMPETLDYSAVMAVHTLWLAARAAGIGVGWVSILEPGIVQAALDVPETWRLVAYLCIGYPARDEDAPLLERAGWEQRRLTAGKVLRR
ncbi:5,6-dimethylbenzimidazole synthase [uncultured Enterovirga sp.]|uniref:5,6-dimethylbenzimidazole synthase n=1 Tax=uncultured Enterovirga sp. TaxID=2026352 RepID=UPI0035CAC56B